MTVKEIAALGKRAGQRLGKQSRVIEALVGKHDAARLDQARQHRCQPSGEFGVALGVAGAQIIVH